MTAIRFRIGSPTLLGIRNDLRPESLVASRMSDSVYAFAGSRHGKKQFHSASVKGAQRTWGCCRVSLLSALGLLILKDFHAWETLELCFIAYSFSLIKSPREPHFPSRDQRYVLDSTRLPFLFSFNDCSFSLISAPGDKPCSGAFGAMQE
ncbi:MAG: hypothetical protein WCA20_03950 [Candidatus Sulfotelmatobacter sp.]